MKIFGTSTDEYYYWGPSNPFARCEFDVGSEHKGALVRIVCGIEDFDGTSNNVNDFDFWWTFKEAPSGHSVHSPRGNRGTFVVNASLAINEPGSYWIEAGMVSWSSEHYRCQIAISVILANEIATSNVFTNQGT